MSWRFLWRNVNKKARQRRRRRRRRGRWRVICVFFSPERRGGLSGSEKRSLGGVVNESDTENKNGILCRRVHWVS